MAPRRGPTRDELQRQRDSEAEKRMPSLGWLCSSRTSLGSCSQWKSGDGVILQLDPQRDPGSRQYVAIYPDGRTMNLGDHQDIADAAEFLNGPLKSTAG